MVVGPFGDPPLISNFLSHFCEKCPRKNLPVSANFLHTKFGVKMLTVDGYYYSPIYRDPLSYDDVPLRSENDLRTVYGDTFCNVVGIKNLKEMPGMKASAVNLIVHSSYPENLVSVDLLDGNSAVKGIDSLNRPFILIKAKYYDSVDNKTVECVEVIFKRHPLHSSGGKGKAYEDRYVSAKLNLCNDNKYRVSAFANQCATLDWEKLKKFMAGEPVGIDSIEVKDSYIQRV